MALYSGIVHCKFSSSSRTVKKEYYIDVVYRLPKSIEKIPELWINNSWFYHHENAPAHASLLICGLLVENQTLVMPQLPHSQTQDTILCDFFLFPKKEDLKRRRFSTIQEIREKSQVELARGFTSKCISRVF